MGHFLREGREPLLKKHSLFSIFSIFVKYDFWQNLKILLPTMKDKPAVFSDKEEK